MTAGWLSRRLRATALVWRLTLAVLVAGLAIINATGVYAQLVRPCRRAWSGYIGDRDAGRDSCGPEVAAHTVADLDRRLGQIDSTIEESAKRGRATSALTAIEALRKTREAFAARRQLEGKALADLKAERFASSAKIRQIESEDTPIRYVAELLGADGDIERAIRWLILVMVLCCDPLAIALTAAVASAPQ